MPRPQAEILAAFAAVILLAGCAGPDASGARGTTQRFYAAIEAKDGKGACDQLSRATSEAVEEEAGKACPAAILEAELEPAGVSHVEVASMAAAVELTGGQYVFLDRSSGGWEISAAGCQPASPDAPYDCQVED